MTTITYRRTNADHGETRSVHVTHDYKIRVFNGYWARWIGYRRDLPHVTDDQWFGVPPGEGWTRTEADGRG